MTHKYLSTLFTDDVKAAQASAAAATLCSATAPENLSRMAWPTASSMRRTSRLRPSEMVTRYQQLLPSPPPASRRAPRSRNA